MCGWYNLEGPQQDVVISSRVRLARNLDKYCFVNRINSEDAKKVVEEVKNAVLNGSSYLANQFNFVDMQETEATDKISLFEKHLISSNLIENRNTIGGALISNDENISIMINEEDHIRIQSILPGMQLNKAMDLSNKIDSLIEEKVQYAFDDEYGYLTSCPTNVGTGLRASVMVHLPALRMIGYINGLIATINKLGITVRGIYGEGSPVAGNIFQISNQITLGQSEQDVIENLNSIILQIIEKERLTREKLLEENRIEIEDKVLRAYGICANARLLTSNECMNLLSDIRFGVELGIISDIDICTLNSLMINTQPGSIQRSKGVSMTEHERDIERALIVRNKLTGKER